jgi:23S rRNA (cytidine1920-2'-O)/16S rRNA (cytidine1409-2'-O)-methyltransferase
MLERLDKVLVDRGIAASRTQAQRLIEAGAISTKSGGAWKVLDKAAAKISPDTDLRSDPIDELRYVSRAGLKLELALQHLIEHGIWPDLSPLIDAMVLDVGQSTGGFTDCAIQKGASKVVGVDVGHDQLSASLRSHPRVVCLEGINARELPLSLRSDFAPNGFDLAVMDVSFISQRLVIPSLAPQIRPDGWLVSLVKPQFEVGKAGLGKGGIVKNAELFAQVETDICACLAQHQLIVKAFFESGIQGSDGNREFFAVAQKQP